MTSIARWQIGLASAAVLASVAWILDATLRDPNVPFVTRAGGPSWISAYEPTFADAIRVDRRNVPTYTFTTTFPLDAVPKESVARFRALGELSLRINERLVWESGPESSWKRETTLPVGQALRAGSNEIRAQVANPRGPALLQLRLAAGDAVLSETDPSWRVVGPRGRSFETVRATDTRIDPQSLALPATGVLLVRHAGVLLLAFAFGAALHVALGRTLPRGARRRAPDVALALTTGFWILVFAAKTSGLPVLMGFDIVGHLAYIDFLLEHRALPLASDGGSMYHPPFAHALIAALATLFGLAPGDAAARWVYRLPGFLSGLGNVWLVWLVARRLFPDDPRRTAVAVGFAGLLPMNVYMGAYVSNEPVHSFLVSASLCIACAVLAGGGASAGRVAALGATLGLAVLTKFTALLAVPIVAAGLAARGWLVDRKPLLRALGPAAAVVGGVAGVAGWFYARNQIHFGRPVVGNWDLPGDVGWWEQPGFHTLDYYTSFGQALSHPFFAGYASFWDGVYSTFWGDGLVAGMVRVGTRHEAWSYDYVTLVYWLAFPATLLLALGFSRALRLCVRGDDLGRRLAFSTLVVFLYAACFALLAITLQLPYYAQAKAFYALSAIVPLSLVAGLGLAWPLERLESSGLPWLAPLYSGWLATLALSVVIAFLGG